MGPLRPRATTPTKVLTCNATLKIAQAPVFWLHTSSTLGALYTRVGYIGSYNVSGSNKAKQLPHKINPTVY